MSETPDQTALAPPPKAKHPAVVAAKADAEASFQADLAAAPIYLRSGLYGRFTSPEQFAAILAVGRSYGMTPHHALSTLYISKGGQVTMEAKAMLALLYASGQVKVTFNRRELDENGQPDVTITMSRTDDHGSLPVTWNAARIAKCRAASQHQDHLLEWATWRAITEAARLVAPDVLAGLYSTDELADGEVTPYPEPSTDDAWIDIETTTPANPPQPATVGRFLADQLTRSISLRQAEHDLPPNLLPVACASFVDGCGKQDLRLLTHDEYADLCSKLNHIVDEHLSSKEP